MLRAIKSETEVRFPDLGITLTMKQYQGLLEHFWDLERVACIDDAIDALVDRFLSYGEDDPVRVNFSDHVKMAEYMSSHSEALCEKFKDNADRYWETRDEEAYNHGFDIAEAVWNDIKDDVVWGALGRSAGIND